LWRWGRIRDISDLAGLYFVKWRQDDYETGRRLHKRKPAKCHVNDTGTTGWEQGSVSVAVRIAVVRPHGVGPA